MLRNLWLIIMPFQTCMIVWQHRTLFHGGITHTVCFCELWGHSIGVMVFILDKPYFLLPYTNPTPKPTPYRKLCIFTFSKKKNSSCMIYKPFKKWGHEIMSSYKLPSPRHTHVIIQNLCPHMSHKHTHAQFLKIRSTKTSTFTFFNELYLQRYIFVLKHFILLSLEVSTQSWVQYILFNTDWIKE